MKRRTEYCGLISEKLVGQTVTLDGWVAKRRDHGGVIFKLSSILRVIKKRLKLQKNYVLNT